MIRIILNWLFIPIVYGIQTRIQSYDFITNSILTKLSPSKTILKFNSYNQTYEFELIPMDGLNSYESTIQIHSKDEQYEMDLDSMYLYSGKLRDGQDSNSWVRILIPNDDVDRMQGVIMIHGEFLQIKSISDYQQTKNFNDIEVATPYSRLSNHRYSKVMIFNDNHDVSDQIVSTQTLIKRQSDFTYCGMLNPTVTQKKFISHLLNDNTTDAHHCPSKTKVLMMGIVADCTYVQTKGGISNTIDSILTNWAIVSNIYEKNFNIRIMISTIVIKEYCTPNDNLSIWNSDCTNIQLTLIKRLSEFSRWTGDRTESVGLWHLHTKCSTLPEVGMAWLATLCERNVLKQGSGDSEIFVSGSGISSVTPIEWKVIAHELGHNFGALHDCDSHTCLSESSMCTKCTEGVDSCNCNGKFLMSATDSGTTDLFSPNTFNLICPTIQKLGTCLKDLDELRTPFVKGICGNGIRENDEQCDCGSEVDCIKDACCDGKTCRLKPNAQCDKNDLCCNELCQLKPNNVKCHIASNECDSDAFCSGQTSICPTDTFLPNGSRCTNNGTSAVCTSGVCTTRDAQCLVNTMGITTIQSCPEYDNECDIVCQDSNKKCFRMRGSFLDGTTCSGDGHCQAGVCIGWTIWGKALLYLHNFPQYGWPIFSISLLVIIIVFAVLLHRVYRWQSKSKHTPQLQQSQDTFSSLEKLNEY
ncbi:Metallo-peptidase family M12-domain-containing protein [Globomyces pollinis-pini]|nr:Metallo-peptidase family M12-domain-containing protein [Globomyces pollinis-pini]